MDFGFWIAYLDLAGVDIAWWVLANLLFVCQFSVVFSHILGSQFSFSCGTR